MTRRGLLRVVLRGVVGWAAGLACAAALAQGADVTAQAKGLEPEPVLIELSVAEDGVLDWRVTLPAGLQRADFVVRHPPLRQALRALAPTPANDCGQLDEHGVVLADPARCRQLHFRVQPQLLARWATYEVAQPLSGGGVLLHTSYFALAAPGHGLRWRWVPPAGGKVLAEGRLHDTPVVRQLGGAATTQALQAALGGLQDTTQLQGLRALLTQQYVLLSRAPATPLPGGTLVHDAQASPALVAAVGSALQADLQAYGQAYGVVPAGPVGVVLTLADVRGFHGDVTDGRMMRLRVDAKAPPVDGPALQQLRRFVAHEVAHWWNMGVYQSDPQRPWLHEGHADWAALLALHATGQVDAAGLRSELQSAFNTCLLARGRRAAASLPPGYGGADNHYACGMSLMALAQAGVAARRGADAAGRPAPSAPAALSASAPLALLAGLHRGAGPMLDVAGFAAWADAGPAGALGRLLTDPTLPFDATFRQQAAQAGLTQDHPLDAPDVPVPAALRSALAGLLMQQLMRADCGGSFGFWTEADHLRLDDKLACQTLRSGAQATHLQGLPLLAQPGPAWAAVVQACAAGQPLRVAYRVGADSHTPCTKPWSALPTSHFVTLQPQALQRLGLAAGR